MSTRYVVARKLNRFGDRDYLVSVTDPRWHTIAVATPRHCPALTRVEAESWAARAAALVPCFMGGRAIQYEVVAL